MNADDPYPFHSSYPVWQIEAVTDALEKKGVEYQIAFDDTGITKMDPVIASIGGTYGDGARANLFIHEGHIDAANSVLKEFNERA